MGQLSGDQLADVRNVACADWATLAGQHCRHRNRGASKGHELDLVGFAIAMDMHNGADIAGFQALGRKINSQDHTVVFVDIHSSKG